MIRTLLSRRRTEDARADAFVAAIRATAPGAVPLVDRRTDTIQFPRLVLTAAVPLVAAGVLLSGCSTAPEFPTPAPTLEQLTGTDAGLITEPAPTVQEWEAQERMGAGGMRCADPAAVVIAVGPSGEFWCQVAG